MNHHIGIKNCYAFDIGDMAGIVVVVKYGISLNLNGENKTNTSTTAKSTTTKCIKKLNQIIVEFVKKLRDPGKWNLYFLIQKNANENATSKLNYD